MTKTDQGFYSLMVAPPEAPRNAQQGKVKAAPSDGVINETARPRTV